jgi:hypothetical protein
MINPERICLASIATPDMEELTQMTWYSNKQEYCKKHGYSGVLLTQTQPYLGFDKILFIEGLLNTNKYDLILWCDNDTLITNFNFKIESIINDKYDFYICTDYGKHVNAGVFIIKNTDNARKYLSHIKVKMYELQKENKFLFGEEQTALIHTYKDENFKDTIKILPQRELNAYPYSGVYGHPNGLNDSLETNGNWEKGDFIIHIPGFGPDLYHKRLEHFRRYSQEVIK